MSQKLPVNGFKWENDLSRFNEDVIKNYNENSDVGYFLEVDVEYPKKLFSAHKELPFLPERKKLEKVEKLVCNIGDKEKYVIHIRPLKQASNHGLTLKEVHRVIQFNQEAWLKPYIDMNTKLRKEAKNEFEKDFFMLMNTSVFRKTMKNVRKHRDIKLVTTEEKRIKLVSEPNYHTTKHFSKNLLAIKMIKAKVKMNKAAYLGMSILDIRKTLMYEIWYDYVKPKYKDKTKLHSSDTDSFVIDIFTEQFFKDINNDVERWFDASTYDENDKRPLQIGVNKIIGMFKDQLGGKIMKEFCALRAKTNTYLMDDDSKRKKAKGIKRCVIKSRLMFENYKDSLFNNKTILKSQLRFKGDHHNVYTEEVNKTVLNTNDDKRLQTFDRVSTYPYRTNAFKVCESEMSSKIRCNV